MAEHDNRKADIEEAQKRIAREDSGVFGSSMRAAAEHDAGADDDNDRATRWGRIVGRTLGFAALVALALNLVFGWVR